MYYSKEQFEKISQKAHKLWEEDGKPHGKAMDHWLQAEQSFSSENEGEGSRTAAHNYNEGVQNFIESGRVASKAAQAAKALDGPEGAELKKAERAGKSRAHIPAAAPAAETRKRRSPAASKIH